MGTRSFSEMYDEVVPEGAANETRVREIEKPGFISGWKNSMRHEGEGLPRRENLCVKNG